MSTWQVGDWILCKADLKNELHDFEALVTGTGDNYLRLDRQGETRACHPKNAVLLRSADGSRRQGDLLAKKRGGSRPGTGRRKGEVSPWVTQPTTTARFPEQFIPELRAIAQQMDWGEWRGPGQSDRTEDADKLDQIKELLQRWNTEAVDKKPKYDRSWGKALHLLAELEQILDS